MSYLGTKGLLPSARCPLRSHGTPRVSSFRGALKVRPCPSPSAVLRSEDQPPWQRVARGEEVGTGDGAALGPRQLPLSPRARPSWCGESYFMSPRLSQPEITARTLRDGPWVTDRETLSGKQEAFIEHLPCARHSTHDRGRLSSLPTPGL